MEPVMLAHAEIVPRIKRIPRRAEKDLVKDFIDDGLALPIVVELRSGRAFFIMLL
jgi:hypothetical protein